MSQEIASKEVHSKTISKLSYLEAYDRLLTAG